MTCEHIYTYINPVRERDIQKALQVLGNDGLIALPTDSSWAIGCNPRSSKAIQRLKNLRPDHPKEQPFSLICSSISMAANIANIDQTAYRILKKALPGPYTFILERHRLLPKQLDDKRKVVGVRIPDAELVLAIVAAFEFPMVVTSIPHTLTDGTAVGPLHFGYEILDHFGHALDLILDLGDEIPAQETTVIDLSEGSPVVVRQGLGATDFI